MCCNPNNTHKCQNDNPKDFNSTDLISALLIGIMFGVVLACIFFL